MPAGIPGHCKMMFDSHSASSHLTEKHIPPVAKDRISRAVKSGFLNISTSKSFPHGKTLIRSGALSTKDSYLTVSCLSTIAANPVNPYESRRVVTMGIVYLPSHSALPPYGST